MEEKVAVFSKVDKETHEKATELCHDRGISLRELIRVLLKWSSDKTVTELYEAGVRIPIYPDDK